MKTMYPKLYRWDQKQQNKLLTGVITKEQYLKEREDNWYGLTDSEDESKEMARINQIASQSSVHTKIRNTEQKLKEGETVQDYNCSVQDVQEVIISSANSSNHQLMSQATLNPDNLVTETS